MKIRNIKIRNFRGIKELDWKLPDKQVFCLIGKGDSTKSTILDAIRYAFYPHWNLSLCDTDFFSCNIHNPIVIEIIVGDIPDDLRSLDKFGQYLFGWDKYGLKCEDEPGDNLEESLIIHFEVGTDLEPSWHILDHKYEIGMPFKQYDRNRANVNFVGSYTDHHLTWGRGSVLSQLTDQESIDPLLAEVARIAKRSLDTNRDDKVNIFNSTAQTAQTIAIRFGVPVLDKYKPQLDIENIQISKGCLSLHDGEIPLRQLGLGSRRLLICGLQQELSTKDHITLIDEVEVGLEPHRITRMIKNILDDESGQYLLTTHSPSVLRELTINELYVVHDHNGVIQILAASDTKLDQFKIQGKIRANAEAFLAEKIIICEGQTEVGFTRGLDNYWLSSGLNCFSLQGVSILNANGAKNVKELAEGLNGLGYKIAVLVDGDAQNNFSEKEAEDLRKIGVEVIMWENGIALEERVIFDLPWEFVIKSAKLAKTEFDQPVIDNIKSAINTKLTENIDEWEDTVNFRRAIGKAAKLSGWFKDITKGERWVNEISPAFTSKDLQENDLMLGINKLRKWVDYA